MPHDLLKALDTLPDTLDETYKRILDGIPQIHLSNSTRIFQFLTYAERPLKIGEVVDILATTPEGDPKFDKGNRMPNQHGILKFCSSLVTISKDREEVQLAHFSVKEYLASPGEKGPFKSNLHESRAHESITRVLLAYLSCFEDWKKWSIDEDAMMWDFPLASYGARYWIEHATRVEKNRATRESILEFFKHEEAYLICTSLIFNPERNSWLYYEDESPGSGFLPLYLASMIGWKHTVEDLLSQDPQSINGESSRGSYGSVLQVACVHHQMDIVRLLLEKGANVNQAFRLLFDYEKMTALLRALIKGHNDLAKLLLEYDADPNIPGNCPLDDVFPEYTKEYIPMRRHIDTYPLILASLRNSEDLTRILLNRGALPNKTDGLRNSALHYACWRTSYTITNVLLSHGADIYGSNRYGETPFHAACQSGCDEAIELLLEKGWAKNPRTLVWGRKCEDALQVASFWGRLNAVKVLLSHGANPSHTDINYGSALHAASSRGHLRVVELLLDRGSNPDILDCHQWTAHFLAFKNGHDDIRKALWHVSAGLPVFRGLQPSTFVGLTKWDNIKVFLSKKKLVSGNRLERCFVYVMND